MAFKCYFCHVFVICSLNTWMKLSSEYWFQTSWLVALFSKFGAAVHSISEPIAERTSYGSKRHSLQAVELSQRTQAAAQIVSNLPAPSNGAQFTVFGACRPYGPTGWLALLLTKAGDVETNPGPTTLNKKVWICDICHKQIHVRKQISIRCNRIEHWVHLRCVGMRQAQYTDTWTCHLHRESRLTPHTDITPTHRSRPWSKPLPTPHLHHRNQNTDTCQTLPLSPQDW